MTTSTTFQGSNPPGPTGLASIAALHQLRQNPIRTMSALARTYGDMVHIGLGPYRVYLLNHPDLLHEMLVRQADIMHKPRSLSRPIAEFLGNGLLVSHGDYWQQQRRIIQPAFHHRYLAHYSRVMVDCILQHIDTWQPGSVYDVDHEFMKITLRMVTRALFDSEITENGDDIAEAVKILQRISYGQGQDPLEIPTWVPLPQHRSKQQAIRLLDDVVMRIIRAGRVNQADGDHLLAMLLNAVTEEGVPLTDAQIRDEVMTVLLAGHESTANAIGWMWYLVAQHQNVAARLRGELEQVLGSRPPTADDLRMLPYTAMIVKEALRLFPPAWALPRETIQDTQIGGYAVRRGSLLFGVPFTIQRDPRYFDHPDEFRPERFAGNAERLLPRHVYLPFGSGPRFCIGNSFALLAMQLSLAVIHQRYHLDLVSDHRVELDPLLTLRPRHGIHMRVCPV